MKAETKTKEPDLLSQPVAAEAPAAQLPATRRKRAQQSVQTAPVDGDSPLLRVILEAAKDPSVDPAKMQALLDMANAEERKEAERAFDEAMLAAQSEMPQVPREAYNKHTKSWWARIESVSANCDPIIRKHGFTLSYGMSDSPLDDHYRVFADVTWRGAVGKRKLSFTKRYQADFGQDYKGPKGEGTKSMAQGSASVITYARRNLKLMIFDVLVLGVDRDGNPDGLEVIDAAELKDLRALLKQANISEETFCSVFKIETVDQLPKSALAKAKDRIAQKQATTG